MYLETQGHFSWLSFLHPVMLTKFWISFYLPSSLPGTEREVVLLHRCVSAAPWHTVWAGGSSGGRQGPQPHPAVAQTPQRLFQQGGSKPLLQQPPHLLAGVNRSHKVCIYVYIFSRKHTVYCYCHTVVLLASHILLCPLFSFSPGEVPDTHEALLNAFKRLDNDISLEAQVGTVCWLHGTQRCWFFEKYLLVLWTWDVLSLKKKKKKSLKL